MDRIHSTVQWYQQKIGSYDKQLWEQSVEQKVLKGMHQAPRRSVRPKTDLIDVDLVRGSTFTKAKPQVPWTYITLTTFSRVVFFPLHYKWWIHHTSPVFWAMLMVLYWLQIFTIYVFFNNVDDELVRDEPHLSEVVIPCVLMVILGLIHSQTMLTHIKPPTRDNKRDGWRRKRSLSQNHTTSTSTNDNPLTPTSDTPAASQSKSSLKGHPGSRPLRERTKERKVRMKVKLSTQRPAAVSSREKQDLDSDLAYHTLEASDSMADRTSSLEQESNDSGRKGYNSIDSKLDISPRVVNPKCVPKVSGNDVTVVSKNACNKLRESQESDLPEDSNSEDDGLLKTATSSNSDKSKRHSQSISSDNEDCEEPVKVQSVIRNVKYSNKSELENVQKSSIIESQDLDKKEMFEGKSYNGTSEHKNDLEDSEKVKNYPFPRSQNNCRSDPMTSSCDLGVSDSSFIDISYDVVTTHVLANGIQDLKITANDNQKFEKIVSNGSDDPKIASNENLDMDEVENRSCPPCQDDSMSLNTNTESENKNSKGVSHSGSVHFTKDLVKLREITPNSSREGTPTHTQSDVLLQSKHIRAGILHNKTDSDTESEDGDVITPCKILPNVRRRKVTVQDVADGSRGRRKGLNLREAQHRKGVSSSDGETEGQSSEYSRSSRGKNMASSEEWGDHLMQTDGSSSESSSCVSEPEVCEPEEPVQESDSGTHSIGPNQGMTASNIHVINLLQPSTAPSSFHGPPDKVTCIIWERNECKKIELTAMDIGWAIIETVDKIPESSDYILIGLTFSIVIGLTPLLFQGFHHKDLPSVISWESFIVCWKLLLCNTWRENLVHTNAVIQRFCLSALFFFMMSVADRTFKQRLLYAKFFCYLTSSRRARKFDMPHFRLNKVKNIRTWLSLRSYLKKRGPQRSVDVIVSNSFLMTLILLILMCLQLLRDAEIYLNYMCNWEILVWCMTLGIYLLRFMTLGLRINKKYRNLSVLITEQINLYLQMEQKPHKKEELMVANNVLKLAESLLKELESPFKISGVSANPLVLNITKVIVLSAFSAVLSEVLGFKLKLYKIKLKA